jgi:hypothetical protein
MPADQARVYWDLLGDLPADVLATAARQAILENRYPVIPTAGTLRQLALELMEPAALQAMEAWELTRKAISRYGYANETRAMATLPEPVRSVVQSLGWQSLCDADADNISTVRAQFRDAYNAIAGRQKREALLPLAHRQLLTRLLLHMEK